MILFIAGIVALINAGRFSVSAAEWYETLRPGVTHSEILKLAGTPSQTNGTVDIYTEQRGRIECTYTNNLLQEAVFYNPPDGAVSWTLYETSGDPQSTDLEYRQAYLQAGNFSVMPNFPGKVIFTQKYKGACYEVNGGFIVVQPIIYIGGRQGFFADKVAQILWLKADGTETVLYRAADHWGNLKPPQLSDNELKRRQWTLKEAGRGVLKKRISDVFGPDDSTMGCGVDLRLFYLEDGLAIITSKDAKTIQDIHILKPGITNLTLDAWLSSQSPVSAK